MTGFHNGPMMGLDVESTGISVEEDRIVTAALVAVEGPKKDSQSWLINPGVPIPEGATNVHGITDAKAATGDNPVEVLPIIGAAITDHLYQGFPLVVFNAPFDLTMLDRELRRYGRDPLDIESFHPIVDPFVLDRAMDPYRKGKRTLTAMCEHYRVPFDGDAHDAEADTFATLRLVWRLAEVWNLGDRDLAELTAQQAVWHRERQESFAAYLRKTGKDDAGVNTSWPIIPKLHSV